jgi:hypothetical protein
MEVTTLPDGRTRFVASDGQEFIVRQDAIRDGAPQIVACEQVSRVSQRSTPDANTDVDLDEWYNPDTVYFNFAWSRENQRVARDNGRLKFSDTANGVQYSGDWLADWFADGCPMEPDPSKPSSGSSAVSITTDSRGNNSMSNESLSIEFKRLVEEKVSGGMPRAEAMSRAVKERPDLHKAYLAVANQGKSATVQDSIANR